MGMKRSRKIGLGLLLISSCGAFGQAAETTIPRETQKGSVLEEAAPAGLVSPGIATSDIYREIDDPNTGVRWLLMRNQEHPAGPGRLIQVKPVASSSGKPGSLAAEVPAPALPVIHAGDTVTVEEKTAVVDAHLEAVALGPAAKGSSFEVRLKIGGKVLRAVALGPGQAAIQGETEARR